MRKIISRIAVAALVAGLCFLFLYPYERPTAPPIVYNGSASLPVGFYHSVAKDNLEPGDTVRIPIPKNMQPILKRWGYDQHQAAQYLLKQIAGVPGQMVCHLGSNVMINGTDLGPIHSVDHLGYSLPQAIPKGACHRLTHGEYFVTTPHGNSFDSRYFGPVERQEILQVLKPLWTWN